MKTKLQNIQALLDELRAPLFAIRAGREQRAKLEAAKAAILTAIELAEYARPKLGEIGEHVRAAHKELSEIRAAEGMRAAAEHLFASKACERILVELLRFE